MSASPLMGSAPILLVALLLACVAGFFMMRRRPCMPLPLVVAAPAIGSVTIVGALSGYAESLDAFTGYLGLAATIFAACVVTGCLAMAERRDIRDDRPDRP